MYSLTLADVTKNFGPVTAVDHLSVDIPPGTIYGFLGPNGAGKTTTLRMLMDIIQPDSGRISVLGETSPARYLSRVSYLPEERGLYPKMRVRNLLAYFAALKGLNSSEIAAAVPRWLSRLELTSHAHKKAEELSRGLHQKLQFAVAVINEPELLILDEPFSGLDPLNLDLLKSIILEFKNQGKTILFSTHDMHGAETLCDAILLINQGRCLLNGSLSQIRSGAAGIDFRRIELEIAGAPGFLETLSYIESVRPCGDHLLEVILKHEADPQQLLGDLIGRVRVERFAIKKTLPP